MEPAEGASLFQFSSHDTALCVIPPQHLWPSIDRLRSGYDKAYGVWPPHINLVYPFVRPEVLPQAASILGQVLANAEDPVQIHIKEHDAFLHKHHNTVFLRPSPDSKAALSRLRTDVCTGLSQRKASNDQFQPHMTIGQSNDSQSSPHKFLMDKARFIDNLSWDLNQVAILIRGTASPDGQGPRRLRLWGVLDIPAKGFTQFAIPKELYDLPHGEEGFSSSSVVASSQTSYHLPQLESTWEHIASLDTSKENHSTPERLVVASYNVLAEFDYPPKSDRYPALVENLLSSRAVADILILQEVTDHFLPHLLADERIRSQYPFSTHGPPGAPSVGPLPSQLNIVVLSRFSMKWEYLPLQRKHKGCAIVTLPRVGVSNKDGDFLPFVLAACHLTQGLADGAVAAKKNELQRILDYLHVNFGENPCIFAGDFNLATSSFTIDAAYKKQDISKQTVRSLQEIDHLLLNAGFRDMWLTTRLGSGESSSVKNTPQTMLDSFEGEQGATFDPLSNSLAARIVGSGLNNRPQRYDRILLRDNSQYNPQGFNMFGQVSQKHHEGADATFASDHWGIRCLLAHSAAATDANESITTMFPIKLQRATSKLQNLDELRQCLEQHDCIPTSSDQEARIAALQTLEKALLDTNRDGKDPQERSGLSLVLVPVGSYGLGVWTRASDIDCLCIGSISTRTFFALALQRLRRATSGEIVVLRRVKANSGYMLELEVQGIKVDLHYCAANSIVEQWPEVMKRPSDDPIFSLPIQTLSKLKPLRDLIYLRRSIPDMTQYQLAHHFIKAWAKERGIYSSIFGFLGGIHISVMLVPICKILAANGETVSTSDIITTFFAHYAEFDWKTGLVFDPFFHKSLRYHRTFREPLCLLGWHGPSLNTAASASIPTVNTIAAEFKRAHTAMSSEDATWYTLFGSGDGDVHQGLGKQGAEGFLGAYRSYIKIDAHYWGPSMANGNRFIGWLESRCIMLLVDIDRKTTGVLARMWPAGFLDRSSKDSEETGEEYQGSYLVGLETDAHVTAGLSKEEMAKSEGALQAVIQDFESRIRGDEKYYDARYCWMSASLIRRQDLGVLTLDDTPRARIIDMVDDQDSDDDFGFDEEEDEDESQTASTDIKDQGPSRRWVKAAPHATRASRGTKPTGLGKFRTAADVLNRLRWDANLDSNDFIVGYEDRFTGAREKAVDQWKSEQTDEEFIPQHRILYFKRKSDGVILWERRTRIDDIFGSGISLGRDSGGSGADTP